MLIEQSAYANRWRKASPAAKAFFALCGFVAAFAAPVPQIAAAIAAGLAIVTVAGAGVPAGRYLRVAAPALLFLAISCLSLAFSLNLSNEGGGLSMQWAPTEAGRIAQVGTRSLAALAALLFLVLTTPLIDLIALLRRLRVPEVLLELMVLCYRMLFVFSEAMRDTLTAQSARLGYASSRLALRSLGLMAANLTLQIWQRAHGLHVAALARNNDGPLRFIEPTYASARRDMVLAALGGGALIAISWAFS